MDLSLIGRNRILSISDALLNINSENGFVIPDNSRQSKIFAKITNLPTKLHLNLHLTFEQVMPCSFQNGTIEIIFQIQHYSIHASANYNGLSHREGYVEGDYIDDGDIYDCCKAPNVFTKEVFETVTYRGKKSRVETKQGTCIVFENNRSNHGLKKLTDQNKDDIIDKRGVLNLFLP